MATPSEKLAESLEELHKLQEGGAVAIRSTDLSRTHRERLTQNGFLEEVMKGWYVASRPDETAGESTAWYASFWEFCAAYLAQVKDDDWCLSPEQSVSLHAENWTVPAQLLVRAKKASNNITTLPHDTSLLDVRTSIPDEKDIEIKEGLRIFSLPAALISCTPGYFKQKPTDVRAALAMVRDASEVLDGLLEGGHSVVAGRLAGAFRNIGRDLIADEILITMRAVGYDVRENDPFSARTKAVLTVREQSPYVNRIRLMWQDLRGKVIDHFPEAPGVPGDSDSYLKQVDGVYVNDAYHSLSIEGYRVTPELIEQVRSGNWNPEENQDDREQRNALAARGYWQAYQAVRKSIALILGGANAGSIADDDHRNWYREMFAPGITAGVLQPGDLAGYRNAPVYIRRSMHVPPNREAVRVAMPAFFDLVREETEASVRVVLGHFIFVYIHPYMDGNGRMGRFLMNSMMASGGYPWTIIPLEKRAEYMASLERASVHQDIEPFTNFLGTLVKAGLAGEAIPEIPK